MVAPFQAHINASFPNSNFCDDMVLCSNIESKGVGYIKLVQPAALRASASRAALCQSVLRRYVYSMMDTL